MGKPYGTSVTYDVGDGDSHPVTDGIDMVTLVNCQTVRVVPGGTEWLRVGKNRVLRPQAASVRYRDRTLTTPGGAVFEAVPAPAQLAVAVEAPSGLCGRGGVMMIGTWDLLGDLTDTNAVLVSRLLDWLAGAEPAGLGRSEDTG